MLDFICAVLMIVGHPLNGTNCPKPEAHEIGVAYLTSYNWQWGGANTDNYPEVTASGIETAPWLFGVGIACPFDMVGNVNLNGSRTAVVIFPEHYHLGERWCIDTFGSELNRHPQLMAVHGHHRWVIRLDFAEQNPTEFVYNNWFIFGVRVEYRPFSELQSLRPGF